MSEEPADLVLEYLTRLDAGMNRPLDGAADLTPSVTDKDERCALVEFSIAAANRLIDRVEIRLDRIERRLDLVNQPH